MEALIVVLFALVYVRIDLGNFQLQLDVVD